MARATIASLVLVAPTLLAPGAAQDLDAFFPVGVRCALDPARPADRVQLEELRRLHFTVVATPAKDGQEDRLAYLDRLLANAPYPGLTLPPGHTAAIVRLTSSADVTRQAWRSFARGARPILFDCGAARARPAELAAAAEFAEAVTRNATLYAPMRPRPAAGPVADVRVTSGAPAVEASMLESPDALLIVAINTTATTQRAVLTFAPQIPEAIWQNLATGATISFVTAAGGTTYTRTFAPDEVLVLMINKRVRSRLLPDPTP